MEIVYFEGKQNEPKVEHKLVIADMKVAANGSFTPPPKEKEDKNN